MTEQEVDELHGRKEDRSLDVKRMPPRTDSLVKHIQGGANGTVPEFLIIIGADENPPGRFDKNKKTPITFPLKVEGQSKPFNSFDGYRLHLIQAVKDQTDKYFEGMFELSEVPITGGSLMVVEVPKSPHRPHQNRKTGAYPIRRDGKTDNMTAIELAQALNAKTVGNDASNNGAFDRAFIEPGDVIVDASDNPFAAGAQEVRTFKGPQAYLRVIPLVKNKNWTSTELRALAEDGVRFLQPLGRWRSSNHHRNEFGFVVWQVEDSAPDLTYTFTQVFGDGELWGVDLGILAHDEETYIPSVALIDTFSKALTNYRLFMEETLGLGPSAMLIAGISGVKGAKIALHNNQWSEKCLKDKIESRIEIQDFASPPGEILRPFFEAVWDACGQTFLV